MLNKQLKKYCRNDMIVYNNKNRKKVGKMKYQLCTSLYYSTNYTSYKYQRMIFADFSINS